MQSRLSKDVRLPEDNALMFCQMDWKQANNNVIHTYYNSAIWHVPKVSKRNGLPSRAPTAIVEDYNRNMGGVDLCDRMLSRYRTKARTRKWTVRTIIFLIDIGVNNYCVQYTDGCTQFIRPRKEIHKLLEFKLPSPTFCFTVTKISPLYVKMLADLRDNVKRPPQLLSFSMRSFQQRGICQGL